MKAGQITKTGILAALALSVFVIEAQLPPIGIPGVKLGLANAVTLAVMIFVNIPCAALVLLIRLILGAVFCGTVMSFAFSLCGGAAAFAVMSLLVNRFARGQLWVVSVFGAAAHSIGQLAAANFFIGSAAVWGLLPLLLICSVISGALVGVIVQRLWFSPLRRSAAGEILKDKNKKAARNKSDS